jgi:hypothetical protein
MNTRPTPETDAFAIKFKTPCGEKYWVPVDIARKLERELAEARGQRDRLAEALRECREDSVELLGERDWWQNEPRLSYYKHYQETRDNVTRADAALQSLTTNETISNQ